MLEVKYIVFSFWKVTIQPVYSLGTTCLLQDAMLPRYEGLDSWLFMPNWLYGWELSWEEEGKASISMIMKILYFWPHRGKEKKKSAFSTSLWIESEWERLCSNSLSCAQLGQVAPVPTMPTQGSAVNPQHGAGMGEFHLESFKVGVWCLWLHLQFKLVYFLLFSFYSTEFSACERC